MVRSCELPGSLTFQVSRGLEDQKGAGRKTLGQCPIGLDTHMGMDQYLLIPFLGGWTSIYQLFWCSLGTPYDKNIEMLTYDFFDALHRQVIHFRRPGKDAAATSQSRGIKFQQLHDSGGPVADSSFPAEADAPAETAAGRIFLPGICWKSTLAPSRGTARSLITKDEGCHSTRLEAAVRMI